MRPSAMNRFIASGFLVGPVLIVGACDSSENDPGGTSGTAGSVSAAGAGIGGTGGHGGAGGSTGNAGGGSAGKGGSAGSGCTFGDALSAGGAPPTEDTGGEGGAGASGAGQFQCIPSLPGVCFGPSLATPGLPFVKGAWAFGDEASVATAELRSPKSGTVCMSGSNARGGTLALQLAEGDAPFTFLAENTPADIPPSWLFHAGALGITSVSFKLDPAPSTGIGIAFQIALPCADVPVWVQPEQDGNPVVITTSATTTLAFGDFTTGDPTLHGPLG